MKTFIIITLLTLTTSVTFADTDSCRTSLTAAKTAVTSAKQIQRVATDPVNSLIADQLMRAAKEQLRTALTICDSNVKLTAKPNPEVDPFEPLPILTLVPVPGLHSPGFNDPVVERECLGTSVTPQCPIIW